MKRLAYPTIILLVLSEIACYNFNLSNPIDFTILSPAFYSIIYFILGVLIAILPVLTYSVDKTLPTNKWTLWIYTGIFLLLSNWLLNEFCLRMKTHPLNIKYAVADMLFYIEIMAKRFLLGAPHIYAKVSEVWGAPFDAVYFPAMWLPFSIPVSLGFDLRWTTFFAIVLSVFTLLFYAFKKQISYYRFACVVLAISFLIYELLRREGEYFMWTEEGVVVFYYALLCYGLLTHSWKTTGIALGLCLFSRFPVVLMFPAVFVLLWQEHKITLVTIALYCMLSMVALLLLSSTIDEVFAILEIPFKYQKMIEKASGWELEGINNHLGMGKFYLGQDKWLRKIALPSTVLLSLGFVILLKTMKTKLPVGFQLLCMLKLTLVIFFNTLLYSYSYLLYTSSFVSIFILIAYPYVIPKKDNDNLLAEPTFL